MKWREIGENWIMRNFISYSSWSIIRMFKSRRKR
jgi:hypothetical protein